MQYRATTTIKHNGVRVQPGDLLDLTEDQAAQLLEAQAIEPVDVPFSAKIKTLGGES